MVGRVKRFDSKKRYGFIVDDEGKEYYVSSREVKVPSGYLGVGSLVIFVPTCNEKGREAVNVRPY